MNLTDEQIIKAIEEWIKTIREDHQRMFAMGASIDCVDETYVEILVNTLDYINRLEAENSRLQVENKGLTKEKEKAWDLFKNKCDEDIELQSLCDKHRLEIERLKEKTRNVFTGVINKFLLLEDLYVIVDDEFVPWEPTEEVEHLFSMSISGDTEENDREIDRVIKELVGECG